MDAFCRRQWDRWFMMGSIGVTVGIIGYCLVFCIELLSDLKYHVVRCNSIRGACARTAGRIFALA